MSRKRVDIAGQRFSHLVALKCVGVDQRHHSLWLCQCDCGNTKIVRASKLREGDIKSCGCFRYTYSHGATDTKLYSIWQTMKARCTVKNSPKYSSYGGRGIKVYPQWERNFDAFRAYVSLLPHFGEPGYSLDRKDNNGDYEPGNIRWATRKEQANNTRTNRILEYNGESHTISEWSDITGISKEALYHRLERGWDINETLSTPVKRRKKA